LIGVSCHISNILMCKSKLTKVHLKTRQMGRGTIYLYFCWSRRWRKTSYIYLTTSTKYTNLTNFHAKEHINSWLIYSVSCFRNLKPQTKQILSIWIKPDGAMYRFMKVACISSSTLMNHQKYYLYPSITHVWHNYQKSYIRDVKEVGRSVELVRRKSWHSWTQC
jgi:hypothetical protein